VLAAYTFFPEASQRDKSISVAANNVSKARHSGAGRNPVLSLDVIPAQAGHATAELVIHRDRDTIPTQPSP